MKVSNVDSHDKTNVNDKKNLNVEKIEFLNEREMRSYVKSCV